MGRFVALLMVCSFALAPGAASYGQGIPGSLGSAGPFSGAQLKTPLFLELGLRKYINSFTSWQFPGQPGTSEAGIDPISRLEWPWDQWFGVVRAGSVFDSFAVRGELAATLLTFNTRKGQDSDWEDPGNPGQKTIFSEGEDRPRIVMADLSVELPMPGSPSIKGVLGWRKQRFNFSYAEVFERHLSPPSASYSPDEGISFSQSYTHYYGGGIFGTAIDLGTIGNTVLPMLLVEVQGDFAYVKANNVDQHFNRPVEKQPNFARMTTTGNAWHVKLRLGLLLTDALSVNAEGDFARITTTGSFHDIQGASDSSWEGAKVWSDQQYVELNGVVRF